VIVAKIIYKNYFESFHYQKNNSTAAGDLGLGLPCRQIDKTRFMQRIVEILYRKIR
jgi:hypothetical protein